MATGQPQFGQHFTSSNMKDPCLGYLTALMMQKQPKTIALPCSKEDWQWLDNLSRLLITICHSREIALHFHSHSLPLGFLVLFSISLCRCSTRFFFEVVPHSAPEAERQAICHWENARVGEDLYTPRMPMSRGRPGHTTCQCESGSLSREESRLEPRAPRCQRRHFSWF